jgi:hypothetical protein
VVDPAATEANFASVQVRKNSVASLSGSGAAGAGGGKKLTPAQQAALQEDAAREWAACAVYGEDPNAVVSQFGVVPGATVYLTVAPVAMPSPIPVPAVEDALFAAAGGAGGRGKKGAPQGRDSSPASRGKASRGQSMDSARSGH